MGSLAFTYIHICVCEVNRRKCQWTCPVSHYPPRKLSIFPYFITFDWEAQCHNRHLKLIELSPRLSPQGMPSTFFSPIFLIWISGIFVLLLPLLFQLSSECKKFLLIRGQWNWQVLNLLILGTWSSLWLIFLIAFPFPFPEIYDVFFMAAKSKVNFRHLFPRKFQFTLEAICY